MSKLSTNPHLLLAFKRGDHDALTEVYRAYSQDIFFLLTQGFSFKGGSETHFFKGYQNAWEVESKIQEVFIRAFSDRARFAYDGIRPYKNYLLTIAKNIVIDSFRAKQRRLIPWEELSIPEVDLALENTANHSLDPEAEINDRELSKHVSAFFESLSAPERAIFEARFQNMRSIEATAKALRIKEYQVKQTEKRIKKTFFKHMQAHGYFQGVRFSGPSAKKFGFLLELVFYWWSTK